MSVILITFLKLMDSATDLFPLTSTPQKQKKNSPF